MNGDYCLCGWRVRSGLPLPELLPWTGAPDAAVDVTVAAEPIDAEIVAATRGGYSCVTDDGALFFQIPGKLRILTRDGARISVDAEKPDRAFGWRLFVLGTGLYHLCHQRDLFPLHAACLRIGDRTVAVVGRSGAGKSTLSAVLNRRGHILLSDDIAVLDTQAAGDVVLVRPSFPRLRLWQDAMTALALPEHSAIPVREDLPKYALESRTGFDPAPRRLDCILVLEEGSAPKLHEVPPILAVPLLQGHVHRPRLIERLGRQATVLRQSAAIAERVPVRRLVRPFRFDALEETADLIEAVFDS